MNRLKEINRELSNLEEVRTRLKTLADAFKRIGYNTLSEDVCLLMTEMSLSEYNIKKMAKEIMHDLIKTKGEKVEALLDLSIMSSIPQSLPARLRDGHTCKYRGRCPFIGEKETPGHIPECFDGSKKCECYNWNGEVRRLFEGVAEFIEIS